MSNSTKFIIMLTLCFLALQILNYGDATAEEICATASRVITFLDLAGHQKYIKTTIFGLTGYSPEVVMLIVAANRGIGKYIEEFESRVVCYESVYLKTVESMTCETKY